MMPEHGPLFLRPGGQGQGSSALRPRDFGHRFPRRPRCHSAMVMGWTAALSPSTLRTRPLKSLPPGKAERPIPGTLIPGTRRFAAPSAAPASVAAPPSRTCGASDSVLHQRSGRQASVSPRATADTRAAMTAESTAVCDQQTVRPQRAQSRCSRGVQRLGARLTDSRCPPESWWTTMRIRADLPGLCQRHRRCVRPQIPGFSPGGLGPHLTSSGSPCGLSSGFPFARRVLPLRPPSSGFPSSGVLRFVPFGRCPGSGSPSVSLRVPFP